MNLRLMQGSPGVTPGAVPVHACRRCGRAAVRYLGGKRRSFYCGEHGPSKLTDWTRLIPIPVEEYEVAGRLPSVAPPLPARMARLIDGLVEGLREALADIPAAQVPDMEAVRALEAEVTDLRQRLQRAEHDRDEYAEMANEVLTLVPAAARAEAEALSEVLSTPTERDLPQPTPGPTPGAPSDRPSIPGPIMPEETPKPSKPRLVPDEKGKPGKGYHVDPPAPRPEPVTVEQEQDREEEPALPSRLPDGMVAYTATDVEMFSLLTLVDRFPKVRVGPGKVYAIGMTNRAHKDYKTLTTATKLDFLYALQFLNVAPQNLREVSLHGEHEGLSSLRINRQYRMIVEWPETHQVLIRRIVNRGDKRYFQSER